MTVALYTSPIVIRFLNSFPELFWIFILPYETQDNPNEIKFLFYGKENLHIKLFYAHMVSFHIFDLCFCVNQTSLGDKFPSSSSKGSG